MKWIVLFFMTLLAGCAVLMAPPSPLPTPTTVTGTLLPVETIVQGTVCKKLETEYQVLFVTSEEAWSDVQSELLESISPTTDTARIAEAVQQTDFQTHGLLLAVRTCHPNSSYTITIDRVVEVSNEQLYVYVKLRDPAPDRGTEPAETGYYHFARILWPEENADDPTIEVVSYTLLIGSDEPIIE
ncbi:MAG: hypothetical protein IT328_24180 [Caldilineaceae bacterium]|nr:hypothetical protein [Caldilineaceae bacterium]